MEILLFLLDILVILGVLLVARRAIDKTVPDPWVRSLTAAQAAVTVIAIIIAGLWYVVEQPHSPKIKIDESLTGMRFTPDQGRDTPDKVIVEAEVTLTNVGSSVVNFRDNKSSVYIQQTFPAPANPNLGPKDKNREFAINRAEDLNYAIAEDSTPLTVFLESGESENLYYRAIIPCQKDLHIYFSFRLRRPATMTDWIFGVKNFEFRKQTPLELTKECLPSSQRDKSTE